MATAKTNSDSLGFYLTGATQSDEAQKSVLAALGNFRSSEEVQEIAFLVDDIDQMTQVVIDRIIGKNGEGTGNINGTASTLAFTGPGGIEGAPVTIADGATALIEDTATGLAMRVSRVGSDGFAEGRPMPVIFSKPFHNLIGMDDVTNAVFGLDTYLAGMLYAHGANELTLVRAHIRVLGTQQTSDTADLAGSGTGTIGTSGSFADWSDAGWCRVADSGGTLKEIVYYTSRTATVLTISAAGHRGLLGTSATAGTNTDLVDAVPGIRIALETPSSGAIQTIANDATAPTGRTFSTEITAATGLNIGTMTAGTEIGLWIHREIPTGAVTAIETESAIEFSWTEQTVAYTNPVSGFYRMEDTTLAGNLLFIGVDADPDFTAAPDDSGALPLVTALTPGGGDTEHRAVLKVQNAYGLRGANQYIRRTNIDNAGLFLRRLGEPVEVDLEEPIGNGGFIELSALYNKIEDGDFPATHFRYWVSTDGSDPVPASDPSTDVEVGPNDPLTGSGRRRLGVQLGPFGTGTDVRVIVRMTRTSDAAETSNSTATQLTTTLSAPNHPRDPFYWTGETRGEALFEGEFTEVETIIDSGNNVRWVQNANTLDLFDDATLKMRFRFDSIDTANNGIWHTLSGKTEVISGAGTGTFDVVSSTEWYWVVDSIRRSKFDLSLNEWSIQPVRFRPDGTGLVTTGSSDPIVDLVGYVAFQVYDRATEQFVTVASLRSDGDFITKIPVRFRASVGDIP
jgi:hypothetical protein